MNHQNWKAAALAAALGAAGCSESPAPAPGADAASAKPVETPVETAAAAMDPQADYPAVLASARKLHQQAVDLEFAWSRTATTLDAAEVAADAGNHAEALALAEQARKLAGLSVAQARAEADAWKNRTP
mgnify:CR=1 FL=1